MTCPACAKSSAKLKKMKSHSGIRNIKEVFLNLIFHVTRFFLHFTLQPNSPAGSKTGNVHIT